MSTEKKLEITHAGFTTTLRRDKDGWFSIQQGRDIVGLWPPEVEQVFEFLRTSAEPTSPTGEKS